MRVRFNKNLSQYEYDVLPVKDPGTVYFLSDTRKIYIDGIEYGTSAQSEGIPVEYELQISPLEKVRRVQSESGQHFQLTYYRGINDSSLGWQWTQESMFQFTSDGKIVINGTEVVDSEGSVLLNGEQTVNGIKTFTAEIMAGAEPTTDESLVNRGWVKTTYDDRIDALETLIDLKADNYYINNTVIDLGHLKVGDSFKEMVFTDLFTSFAEDGFIFLKDTLGTVISIKIDNFRVEVTEGSDIHVIVSFHNLTGDLTYTPFNGTDIMFDDVTKTLTLKKNDFEVTAITIEDGVTENTSWNLNIDQGVTVSQLDKTNPVNPEFNYKRLSDFQEEVDRRFTDLEPVTYMGLITYYGSLTDVSATVAEIGDTAISYADESGVTVYRKHSFNNLGWALDEDLTATLQGGMQWEVENVLDAEDVSGTITFANGVFDISLNSEVYPDGVTIVSNTNKFSVVKTPGRLLFPQDTSKSFDGSVDTTFHLPFVTNATVSKTESAVDIELFKTDTDGLADNITMSIDPVGLDLLDDTFVFAGFYSTFEQLAFIDITEYDSAKTPFAFIRNLDDTGNPSGIYEYNRVATTWEFKPSATLENYFSDAGGAGILTTQQYYNLLSSITPSTELISVKATFTGDSAEIPGLTNSVYHFLYINGLLQQEGVHYTVSGDIITLVSGSGIDTSTANISALLFASLKMGDITLNNVSFSSVFNSEGLRTDMQQGGVSVGTFVAPYATTTSNGIVTGDMVASFTNKVDKPTIGTFEDTDIIGMDNLGNTIKLEFPTVNTSKRIARTMNVGPTYALVDGDTILANLRVDSNVGRGLYDAEIKEVHDYNKNTNYNISITGGMFFEDGIVGSCDFVTSNNIGISPISEDFAENVRMLSLAFETSKDIQEKTNLAKIRMNYMPVGEVITQYYDLVISIIKADDTRGKLLLEKVTYLEEERITIDTTDVVALDPTGEIDNIFTLGLPVKLSMVFDKDGDDCVLGCSFKNVGINGGFFKTVPFGLQGNSTTTTFTDNTGDNLTHVKILKLTAFKSSLDGIAAISNMDSSLYDDSVVSDTFMYGLYV